jgi:hypothetical protein
LEPNKITPGKKTGWQPKPEVQDLIGLAEAELDWGRLGSLLLGPQEPMVNIKMGGQTMLFMVDTGAEHSEVSKPVAPLPEPQQSEPLALKLPGSSADPDMPARRAHGDS